jgi:DsbC/DsbD-like thiol-disulfide interchange protein
MKKILLSGALLLAACAAQAQILTPVKWAYAAKRTSPTEAVILLKATIEPGWHVYSQHVKDGGPVKTTFTFTLSKSYTLVGKTQEPTPVTRFEKTFDMEVSYFAGSVIFQQKVKLTGPGPVTVAGKLEYMTCDDEKCLPPDELPFSVLIK